jgi:Protein of unknown function (DUF3052)
VAGYSGTPLVKKLGIKEGHTVVFPGAPESFAATLGEVPEGVAVKARLAGTADVIVFFTKRRAELERRFVALKRALEPDGGLWIAWPKKASGVETDLTEDVVREMALAGGLVDNKVCAIDETWSGLRLVYRLADRP